MTNKLLTTKITILLFTLFFTGCASTPTSSPGMQSPKGKENRPSSQMPAEQAKHNNSKNEVNTSKPTLEFETDTLYDLIIAEVAGKRNRLDIALGNYMKQAHATKDINIINRYAAIANYMRAEQATLDAITLWLEVKPQDPKAHNMMLMYHIRNNSLSDIEKHFRSVLNTQPTLLEYDFLLLNIRKYNAEDQNNLYTTLERLVSDFGDEYTLWFLMAGIKERQKEFEAALNLTEKVTALDANFTPAILLKVDILGQQGKVNEALKLLKKAAYSEPHNKKLRLIYARTLIKNKAYEIAQKEFEKLVTDFPGDPELLMTLAVLSAEIKMYDQAESVLFRLIEQGQRMNDAYYYLGQISESKKAPKKAIEYYAKIGKGPLFAEAQIKISTIYDAMGEIESAKKQLQVARLEDEARAVDFIVREAELISKYDAPQEAFDFLSLHIENYSDNPSIRYARSMVADKLDLIETLESDLRFILEKNPKSAVALNALGYTLADRNLKLDEAYSLIRQAHELKPEDPAILDSLGWVYYRKGEFQEAITWLKKAYSIMPDPEIAAHFTEALWEQGNKEAALKIWQESIDKNPDHKALKQVQKKYNLNI